MASLISSEEFHWNQTHNGIFEILGGDAWTDSALTRPIFVRDSFGILVPELNCYYMSAMKCD